MFRGLQLVSRRMESLTFPVSCAASNSTLNQAEVDKFSRMAEDWWNPNGVCQPLHSMNSLRIPFIRDRVAPGDMTDKPLRGKTILDIGCGGGIISESLARLGGEVTGLDACRENIEVAKIHAARDSEIASNINYICTTVEDYSARLPSLGCYDAVVASEVLEHVDNPQVFLATATGLVREGGSLFVTTINRTTRSWLLAILAAEHFLRLLPVGTHDWNKFVKPEELESQLDKLGCSTRLINGMLYIPGINSWAWIPDPSVNFALHAVKHEKSKEE